MTVQARISCGGDSGRSKELATGHMVVKPMKSSYPDARQPIYSKSQVSDFPQSPANGLVLYRVLAAQLHLVRSTICGQRLWSEEGADQHALHNAGTHCRTVSCCWCSRHYIHASVYIHFGSPRSLQRTALEKDNFERNRFEEVYVPTRTAPYNRLSLSLLTCRCNLSLSI